MNLVSKQEYKQTIKINRAWIKVNDYLIPKDSYEKGHIKNNLGENIDLDQAISLGISKHYIDSSNGFGTNFHSVYQESPNIYDLFSLAEDPENKIFEKIIDLQKKYNLSSVLDIACGTGNFLKKFFDNKTFSKLYGLDINKSLLDYAKLKLDDSIHLIFSEAEKIPLLDNQVDLSITTWGSFSPSESFYEMERVTKNGGVIVRVGTAGNDDLTNLFPKYDEKTVLLNTKFLELHGFTSIVFPINIDFKSLEEAKNILSQITGCHKDQIIKKTLVHKVMFSWKKVNK